MDHLQNNRPSNGAELEQALADLVRIGLESTDPDFIALSSVDNEQVRAIHRTAIAQAEIEYLIDIFVLALSLMEDEQHVPAVRIFASALPPWLSIVQQADLAERFAQRLSQSQLRQSLSEVFLDHLPAAAELRSPSVQSVGSEFEVVPMDLEDVVVPPPRVFLWLESSVINSRDPREVYPPFYGDDVPNSAVVNQLDDLTIDLCNLSNALRAYLEKIFLMFTDFSQSDGFNTSGIQDHLFAIANLLDTVLLPEIHDIAPSRVKTLAIGLEVGEGLLETVKDDLFKAEEYIVSQERRVLSEGDKTKAYASRYERSRHRYFLRWLIANFQTARLREMTIPSIVQPQPIVHAYDESETRCPICCEDLPEDGELCHPAVSSFACCSKGFHTDCLLSCIFDKLGKGTPCPMCRAPLGREYLGELLEQKVRELQVL